MDRFRGLVAVLAGLIAGLFPALQASKTDLNEILKAQPTTGGGRSWHAWHGSWRQALPALMIAELSLALVLLVGAGLMINSFLRLMAVPKGFNPEGVLTLKLSPSFIKYLRGSPPHHAYAQEALTRVQALPGIQSAGLTGFLPLAFESDLVTMEPKFIEGRPLIKPGREVFINLNQISSDYFQTMGIGMRAGRSFTSQDGSGAPKVAIINETIARRFFPNEDPIGHRLLLTSSPLTIVGVAGDTHHNGLDREVSPEVYVP
jgi:putative ABC transport system permease protein